MDRCMTEMGLWAVVCRDEDQSFTAARQAEVQAEELLPSFARRWEGLWPNGHSRYLIGQTYLLRNPTPSVIRSIHLRSLSDFVFLSITITTFFFFLLLFFSGQHYGFSEELEAIEACLQWHCRC